ncbi:MAG: CoA pyrophosphatase [Paludibacter sp.]
MNFSIDQIKQKLQLPLPGIPSHLKMAPPQRAQDIVNLKDNTFNAKKSAVLILFFHEDDNLKMIVIRRSVYVGIHSGQIAFPGGRYEEEDKDVRTTALREIQEEIGISEDKIEILGRLSDIYVPPSNFLISVFVGYLAEKPIYQIDEREVDEVIEIPFAEFFNHDTIKEKSFFVNSIKAADNAPYFDVSNAEIWGASAMVISELLDVLKEPLAPKGGLN